MAKVKPIRKFATKSVSDAIEKSVNSVVNSGIDISELVKAVENEPESIVAQNSFNQKDLDELVQLKSRVSSIPGQSLTNDPNTPYDLEKPAKYANPREALTAITAELLEPEKARLIIESLIEGMSVVDITLSVLYTKFYQGEINPDTMLLLIEPIMYTIMGLGSEANVEYNIEPHDVNELDEEEQEEKINEFRNAVDNIKNKSKEEGKDIRIKQGVLPKSLLEKIETTGSEIKSLLNKTEEE